VLAQPADKAGTAPAFEAFSAPYPHPIGKDTWDDTMRVVKTALEAKNGKGKSWPENIQPSKDVLNNPNIISYCSQTANPGPPPPANFVASEESQDGKRVQYYFTFTFTKDNYPCK